MIPMKKESKTICFNDFTQAVPYSNDTAVGLFVTSLERNGDGESLGVLIVIMQLAPAGFHAMLDDRHAEPGTAGIFLRLFAPEERFGDVLHFLGGDAGAAVADFHAHTVPLRPCGNGDGAVFPGITHGVAHHVGERPAEAACVRPDLEPLVDAQAHVAVPGFAACHILEQRREGYGLTGG